VDVRHGIRSADVMSNRAFFGALGEGPDVADREFVQVNVVCRDDAGNNLVHFIRDRSTERHTDALRSAGHPVIFSPVRDQTLQTPTTASGFHADETSHASRFDTSKPAFMACLRRISEAPRHLVFLEKRRVIKDVSHRRSGASESESVWSRLAANLSGQRLQRTTNAVIVKPEPRRPVDLSRKLVVSLRWCVCSRRSPT